MPLDIVHIVVRLVKRVYRPHARRRRRRLRQTLGPPQLHRPVDRTRQEQVGEIDGPVQRMEVQAHDGACVCLVHVVLVQTGFSTCAVVPVRLVDVAFLGANPERRRFVVGEVQRRDRHLTSLVVPGVH